MQNFLAQCVRRNKGYKKSDLAKKTKYEIILAQIKEKPEMVDLKITASALEVAFKRHQAAVLGKYGIDEEGANLSGLDGQEPSELEKLYLDFTREYKSLLRQEIGP